MSLESQCKHSPTMFAFCKSTSFLLKPLVFVDNRKEKKKSFLEHASDTVSLFYAFPDSCESNIKPNRKYALFHQCILEKILISRCTLFRVSKEKAKYQF